MAEASSKSTKTTIQIYGVHVTLQVGSTRSKMQAKQLTARERAQAWYDHMKGVLAQDPANMGKTVTMLNNGRTYRFHIAAPPLPVVEDVAPVVAKAPKAKKQRTTRKKAVAS